MKCLVLVAALLVVNAPVVGQSFVRHVTIKADQGMYVCALPKDQRYRIVADREWAKEWEVFEEYKNANGTFSYKTYHGQWIRATGDQDKYSLFGDREKPDTAEMFQVGKGQGGFSNFSTIQSIVMDKFFWGSHLNDDGEDGGPGTVLVNKKAPAGGGEHFLIEKVAAPKYEYEFERMFDYKQNIGIDGLGRYVSYYVLKISKIKGENRFKVLLVQVHSYIRVAATGKKIDEKPAKVLADITMSGDGTVSKSKDNIFEWELSISNGKVRAKVYISLEFGGKTFKEKVFDGDFKF